MNALNEAIKNTKYFKVIPFENCSFFTIKEYHCFKALALRECEGLKNSSCINNFQGLDRSALITAKLWANVHKDIADSFPELVGRNFSHDEDKHYNKRFDNEIVIAGLIKCYSYALRLSDSRKYIGEMFKKAKQYALNKIITGGCGVECNTLGHEFISWLQKIIS